MKKAVLVILGLVVLGGIVFGGRVAYQAHKDSEFLAKVQPLVRGATVRMAATVEMSRSDNITWKEAFERSESHLAEIDKLALQVKELVPDSDVQRSAARAADEYMGAAQGLIRAQLGYMRAAFQLSTQTDRMQDLVDAPRGRYSPDFWLSQFDSIKQATEKAKRDRAHALNVYIVTTSAVLRTVDGISSTLGTQYVIDRSLLAAHKAVLDQVDQGSKPSTQNVAATPATSNNDGATLAQKNACTACHATDMKLVGPAFKEVAKRYRGKASAQQTLISHVRDGSVGQWGSVPMPPNTHVSDSDLATLASWVLSM